MQSPTGGTDDTVNSRLDVAASQVGENLGGLARGKGKKVSDGHDTPDKVSNMRSRDDLRLPQHDQGCI